MTKSAQLLRSEMLDKIAPEAEKDLNDTKYDWLRTPQRRRDVVKITYAFLVCHLAAILFGENNGAIGPFVSLFGLLGYLGMLVPLRLSVRNITDLPDELIDERMRERRGETYRLSFLGCMSLFSLLAAGYVINEVLAKFGVVSAITASTLFDLILWCFFAALALPGSLFAWREPEI